MSFVKSWLNWIFSGRTRPSWLARSSSTLSNRLTTGATGLPSPTGPPVTNCSRVPAMSPAPCRTGVAARASSRVRADLYDPLSMPPALVKAHAELDRAVDLCYRPQSFTSERQRVEYLFGLYEQLTAPLLSATKPKRSRKRVSG